MKKAILFSLFLFSLSILIAQPALVEIPLYAYNDDIGYVALSFGLDPYATNGIDAGLEESLPPPPPSDVFDARFKGDALVPPLPLLDGLIGDYRNGNTGTVGQSIHQINFQKGGGSTYTIAWDLPDGVTGVMEDFFGGVFYSVNMTGQGSLTVTNPVIIDKLKMTINYNLTPPAINGDLSEIDYELVTDKKNTNLGFGEFIDITKIVYRKIWYINALYLGIEGKLDLSNNGIGLWLGFTETTGSSAGAALGGSPGGHYMGGNGGTNAAFKADFEVDYMFAMNPGSGTTSLFVDAVKLVGGRTASYIGASDQLGNTATGPSPAGIFRENSVSFAFVNGGASNKGFEICLPFSELGVTQLGDFQVFAFIVSNTAFFSDVTVPGNITTGNPGFDADFNTIATGPFHSGFFPLPVELSTFIARAAGNKVELNWETATEIDNYGFEIERKSDQSDWKILGFVEGHGMSSSPKYYSFTDNNPEYGTLLYRLKQIDTNGGYEYSETVEVNIGLPDEYLLKQNYPNPFNPATKIAFVLPQRESVKVAVYNTLGEQVIELANREFEAGLNELEFKADGLSSGIYFYRVETSGFSDVKKMILLR